VRPLVGGNAATMHVLGDRSSAAQGQRNHRPMRRAPDNNAEAIIILDGHPKGPDTEFVYY